MSFAAVRKLWWYLTMPGEAAQDYVTVHHTRLLLSLVLALVPLGLLIVIMPNFGPDDSLWKDEDLLALAGGLLVWVPAYFLGRRGHYRWATRIMLAVALGVILAAGHPDPLDDYAYLLFLGLFSSILLPYRETVVVAATSLSVVLLVPLVTKNTDFLEIIVGPWSFLLIGFALTLIGARHRTLLEQERQRELATRLQQIQAVYRMSVAVSRAGSLQSIYENALDGLLRGLSVDRAALLLFDEEGVIRFKAWRGLSAQYRQAVAGHCPWPADAVNPQPLLVSDVATDTQMPAFHEVLKAEGIMGLAFIPLVHQGSLLGKFMLYCDRPHQFSDTELQLAQTMASQIAFALARKQSEEALRISQERYELATHAARVGVWDWRASDRGAVHIDPNMKALLGYGEDELGDGVRQWQELIHAEDLAGLEANMQAHFVGKTPEFIIEHRMRHKDGSFRWLLARGRAFHDDEGHIVRVVGTDTDVTERKEAELALQANKELMYRQQKVESLGMLAGGVAHDFNNLLVAMLGQSSLALAKMDEEDAGYRHVEKMVRAAEKAAELTKQLLAYSGRGHFSKKALHLNELVADNLHLFRVAIPKHVSLSADLVPDLPLIEADPGQMQQVIMNLLLNAAEAIQESGEVKMSTTVTRLTPSDPRSIQQNGDALPPGRYVELSVIDDGCGMDEETVSRIFDPFFTTKFTGRGLGLAAVLGIVQGHRGGIQVRSTSGVGTVIHVLFPVLVPESAVNQ